MADLVLDTDVLIDHLRGARPLLREFEGAAYSSVTRAELYAGVENSDIEALLSTLVEIPFEKAIADGAGQIKRSIGLGLADAAIASTALVMGRTLVSRNRKHFARVKGLTLRAP